MIANNFPSTKVDEDLKRRRVLAKVYGLLIRLGDKGESNNISDSTPVEVPREDIPALVSQEDSIPTNPEENEVALRNDISE